MERTGTWYETEGLEYCEDDNTYTPYTINRQAWASPVALRCELTCAVPLTSDEIIELMFGPSN